MRDGPQLEEIVPGVVNIEDLVLSTLAWSGLQGSVVSSLLVPLTYSRITLVTQQGHEKISNNSPW